MPGISLRPSTFTAGGSLIDDVDAEVVRARWVMFDYDGKSDAPAPSLMLVLKHGEDLEDVQYYSAGNSQFFVPSEDPKDPEKNGISLVAVGTKTSLNGGTNTAIMINSLVQAGFPEDLLDKDDIRVLEGLVAHWNRVPQPKRSNLPTKQGQSERAPMVLVVTSIKSLPGEAKKPKGNVGKAPAPKADTKAAPAPAANGFSPELLEELTGELVGLFASREVSSMKKVDISKFLFSYVDKSSPNRNKLISAAAKDEYLKAVEGFTYNGSVLTREE